jgi:hypothetical protein
MYSCLFNNADDGRSRNTCCEDGEGEEEVVVVEDGGRGGRVFGRLRTGRAAARKKKCMLL